MTEGSDRSGAFGPPKSRKAGTGPRRGPHLRSSPYNFGGARSRRALRERACPFDPDLLTTDLTERGLERRICETLTGSPCEPDAAPSGQVAEPSGGYGGKGWICGSPRHYDAEQCADLAQLAAFLHATQPEVAHALDLDHDTPARRKFLTRLRTEIGRRGVVAALRNGVRHGAHGVTLFYGTPSPGNETATVAFGLNRFSVTRQLRYSRSGRGLALDLALFVNGLPVATFELKNRLTKQTVQDAVRQYQKDRDPRETLFQAGRCLAHFAVDEHEVRFCAHLRGKDSVFLPFNRGWNGGAGNPPNPEGLKTDYLWQSVLDRDRLTDIIENYAQALPAKNGGKGRPVPIPIWPRFHQWDAVRLLLRDAATHGVGRRYLVQHSAGSGKSNSIAWLAHQLIGLRSSGGRLFDQVVVVTDRVLLDRQIRDTIKQFAQVGATVGHAGRSDDLRKFLDGGKPIVISTVQKFPHILDAIHAGKKTKRFAIIIDEAHSSQGGKTTTAMAKVLTEGDGQEEPQTFEDRINRVMEQRRLPGNASFFAFTATPKNRTLEIFGDADPQPGGVVKHRPFHAYPMKQAIQEGFILDVVQNYLPVSSYYHLAKKIADDPEFDTKKAQKKLRRYVEGHDHAIRLKAEIMVDHFHTRVRSRISGKARAMVVTDGVDRAIRYFRAISDYLRRRRSPYRAIVAFSGERVLKGETVSEASLNGFPASEIAAKVRKEPYRFLVCADKFQTGYDEPLLHTMYVDKTLSGIRAVQTLSRLNRSHRGKRDTFVLDFMNDADLIRESFEPYYRTTILSDETDPNRLHDLQAALDAHQVYSQEQVDEVARRFLEGEERDRLDPILDRCVEVYVRELDEAAQVEFKGKVRGFLRAYHFLATILSYSNPEWEKRAILFDLLVDRLPAPVEDDLSRGILEAIDMDSYRIEKQEERRIALADDDGEVDPAPVDGGGFLPEPEMDLLSRILEDFNSRFGNITWEDADRVRRLITKDIPARVVQDTAYGNARKRPDRQNAQVELERALRAAMNAVLQDDTQLFKEFTENDGFRRWMTDSVFRLTYERPPASGG